MTDKDNTRELARGLPQYLPKDSGSGNYALLYPIAQSIDRLNEDVDVVGKNSRLQMATEPAAVERIADMVDLSRREGEAFEKFRLRVSTEFLSLAAEGSVEDIFVILSNLINADLDELRYQDWRQLYGEISTIAFLFPSYRVEDSPVSGPEIVEALNRLAPATKRVKGQYTGSLRPVSVEDYLSESYSPDVGFGSLDGSGNPSESGGTFGGLIE